MLLMLVGNAAMKVHTVPFLSDMLQKAYVEAMIATTTIMTGMMIHHQHQMLFCAVAVNIIIMVASQINADHNAHTGNDVISFDRKLKTYLTLQVWVPLSCLQTYMNE